MQSTRTITGEARLDKFGGGGGRSYTCSHTDSIIKRSQKKLVVQKTNT